MGIHGGMTRGSWGSIKDYLMIQCVNYSEGLSNKVQRG